MRAIYVGPSTTQQSTKGANNLPLGSRSMNYQMLKNLGGIFHCQQPPKCEKELCFEGMIVYMVNRSAADFIPPWGNG